MKKSVTRGIKRNTPADVDDLDDMVIGDVDDMAIEDGEDVEDIEDIVDDVSTRNTKKNKTVGDVEDNVESGEGVIEVQAIQHIPRPWQMSDADLYECVQAYAAWKTRLQSFIWLPVISAKDDLDLWQDRVSELQYLSRELYTLWTRGCSASSPKAQTTTVDENGEEVAVPLAFDPVAIGYCLFFQRVIDVNLSPSMVDEAMAPHKDNINEMVSLHKKYGFCDQDQDEHNQSMSYLNSVRVALENTYRMMHHAASLTIAIDPSKSAIAPSDNVLYMIEKFNRFHVNMKDAHPNTKLVIYLISIAEQRGYRRYRDGVYEQHITPEGHATCFWKRVSSISEFVNSETSLQALGMEFFDAVLGKSMGPKKFAEDYLMSTFDASFPFISLDRHVFSFRNGIYFCATRTFRPYSEGAIDWGTDSFLKPREDVGNVFVGNKGKSYGRPFGTNAAANYFNVDFVDYTAQVMANKDAWFNVPTPTFSKLLNDQEIPEDAQRVVYGLIGRLFYEVGEMDDWQIVLWFLGRANTGKSTMCKVSQIFYQSDDVAVISNNVEQQFGLGSIYDKLVFMAPEVKKDFRLNQAEFQSMVSGEKMSIARKFKDAAGVMWKVPGLLAGNDMPAWMDNSGSVVRRCAVVMCLKSIGRTDQNIITRMRQEVAALIFKSNVAYHMMVESYGDRGAWDCLPAYFKNTQGQLKAKTHPVYHFLKSEHLVYDAEAYMPLEQFKVHYNNHARMNNLKKPQWDDELYQVPLADSGLTLEKREDFTWNEKYYPSSTTVIVGITWRDEGAYQPQQNTAPPSFPNLQRVSPSKKSGVQNVTHAPIPTIQFE